MSEEYESIMRSLKEAVNDAKGNNSLPRETVDGQIKRDYKRLDCSKLKYENTISSQEDLIDIVPFEWDIPDDGKK